MVAPILGIRFRTTANLMRREWWRALITGFGILWILMMLPSLVWIHLSLADAGASLRGDATVMIALLSMLGWTAVPLMIAGLDDTLDPSRFRAIGADAGRLMPGLFVAALLTLPTLFFAVLFVALALAWREDGTATVVTALLGMTLTLLCLVLGARVAVLWGTRVLASRRAKLATAGVVTLGLAAVVPLALNLFSEGLGAVLETDGEVLLAQLAQTPLGAGAAAPRAAAQGDWWGATWRLLMQAGWALVLFGAWRANVDRALVTPLGRGGSRPHDDRILAPRFTLGMPSDPEAAAVHARMRRAWATDPRYLASLTGVLLLPAAFFALVLPVFDLDPRWAYLVPLLLAATVGWGRHNDVAFDSSGLWLDVVSGRLGGAVMRGRMSATAAWALPTVLASAVVTLAWTGRWADAPGLLGACVGAFGVSIGIAAVAAVLVPYRAPSPGQNPFGAEVGTVGAGFASQLASSAVAFALLPVVVVPFVLSLAVAPEWGWLACATGLVAGAAGYIGGIRLAGYVYDRRAGRLLAAVT